VAPVRVTATDLGDVIVLARATRIDSNTSADLALSASTDPVVPGETFDFIVDVGNVSNASLANADVVATLPSGVSVSSASNGGMISGNQVTWSLGTIASGGSARRTVSVTVGNLAAGEVLAAVTDFTADGGLEIDRSSRFAVSVTGAAPPLSVSFTSTPDPVASGGVLSYTIRVDNTSALPVDDIEVLLRVPAELSFSESLDAVPIASCSSSTCDPTEEATWFFGTLTAGASQSFTIDATVASGVLQGT
jgi:uncharacterized repeat protein (TIGR01451 family)